MGDLAPYASDPARTRGRQFAADLARTRTPFQRDRDRIIHSTAFRRLQYKTQVFLHHEGRHYRTRLTHTLEVSQMARSMARALWLNEDLAEAIALAHDLGHTPFGHAGERVLNDKLAEHGGFDHNMQAVRVVTRIENRYAEHDGLNLSWETLEGILKHNGPLLERNGQAFGRYKQEGLPFGWQEFGAGATCDLRLNTYASLEAQIAAIADDIAYNAHDIDDAVRAGLIVLDDLSDLPFAGAILKEIDTRWPGLERGRRTNEVQRRLITRMIEDVIETTSANLVDRAPVSADDVRAAGAPLVAFSPSMDTAVRSLKVYLFEHVYRSESVMRPVRAGEAVVARLFDHFTAKGNLPGRWRGMLDNAGDETARVRVISDFVAGMTDPYATELYEQLFDEKPDFR